MLMLPACRERGGSVEGTQVSKTGELGRGGAEIRNEVRVETLQRRNFDRELLSNGRLAAGKRSELAFAHAGIVTGIYKQNGNRVREGELIACLDTSDDAREMERARLGLEKAELALWDVLLGYGYSLDSTFGIPDGMMKLARIRSGYADAESDYKEAESRLAQCFLRAPFAGKVAGIGKKEYEQASGVFCTLLDDASLSVRFPVLEAEYAYIKQGMKVKIRPFAFQGKEMEGKITHVNPSVDENGQIMVDAVLENDGSLIDGMNVRVVVCQQVPDCFVVPKEAVLLRDGREVLFLYQEGKAVWTYVDILLSNSHEYVVEANRERGGGLEEGDQVIVSGNLNLVDGSDVVLSGGGTGAEHAKAL